MVSSCVNLVTAPGVWTLPIRSLLGFNELRSNLPFLLRHSRVWLGQGLLSLLQSQPPLVQSRTCGKAALFVFLRVLVGEFAPDLGSILWGLPGSAFFSARVWSGLPFLEQTLPKSKSFPLQHGIYSYSHLV